MNLGFICIYAGNAVAHFGKTRAGYQSNVTRPYYRNIQGYFLIRNFVNRQYVTLLRKNDNSMT